jgi:hypothetical protein
MLAVHKGVTKMSESLSDQQTRLSLANLIIAGVNRSATTSLFTYLSEHPEICPSTIKETDYFMPVLEGSALEPIETYASYFKGSQNTRYRMEASPRYFFGGSKLAEKLYEYLGPIRIIFVLRDPITRMVSYFHQRKRSGELPVNMSVDEYSQRALKELPDVLAANNGKPINVYRESIFTRGLAQGFYVDYLKGWYEVFPNTIHVNFFEHMSRDSRPVVEEVCRWLDLDSSLYKTIEFTQENRTVKHKNAMMFKVASHLNDKFEPFWRKHKIVKRWIRDVYLGLNEERSGDPPLSEEVRAKLENAYASRNQRLREMLRRKDYRDLPTWLTRSVGA